MVARYGGEEFVVLLPAVTHHAAMKAAERVRQRIESLGLPHPESNVAPVVTVSIGVATAIPRDDVLKSELVESADRALCEAKHSGRNRVQGSSAASV